MTIPRSTRWPVSSRVNPPTAPPCGRPRPPRWAAASRSRSSASAADSRGQTGPRPSGSCCEPARRRSARFRTRAGREADLHGLDFPRRSGFLESIDRFDADFFGIAPREAIFLDPQQRMLLEVAWEALEDAGQVPERLAGTPVGVFIGISTNDYALIQVKRGGAAIGHRVTGNSGSIAANRISHFFDFRGAEPGDRHGLLVFAGGDPPRLPEPLGRRIRARAGRRREPAPPAAGLRQASPRAGSSRPTGIARPSTRRPMVTSAARAPGSWS